VSAKWLTDAKHDGTSLAGDLTRLGIVTGLTYLGGSLLGLEQQTAIEAAVLIAGTDYLNRPKTFKTVHDVRTKIKSRGNGDVSYERDESDRGQ
jgi:hypothetical protein